LFASVDVMEFQTTEAYSTLALTKVAYNTNMHSRVEKLNVILRIKPSNFIHWENIKLIIIIIIIQ
jgi:hypothetical protein